MTMHILHVCYSTVIDDGKLDYLQVYVCLPWFIWVYIYICVCMCGVYYLLLYTCRRYTWHT